MRGGGGGQGRGTCSPVESCTPDARASVAEECLFTSLQPERSTSARRRELRGGGAAAARLRRRGCGGRHRREEGLLFFVSRSTLRRSAEAVGSFLRAPGSSTPSAARWTPWSMRRPDTV